MTPSKALFYFCITFTLGISLAQLIKIPHIFLWGFLIFGTLLIIISFFVKKEIAIFGFCILFLIIGIVRFQITEFKIENDKLRNLNDSSEKITFTGQVIDGPDIRNTFQKLKLKVENTNSTILVTTGRYPEYHYLDTIKISGNLKTPMVTEDFNYQSYLLKDGIYSVMDFPKIELISKKPDYNIFSYLYDKTLWLKESLRKSINSNFSKPQNSLMEGIVLGSNKNMPVDLKDKLNLTGLSHITAVSGSHIVILSTILMSFLLFIGLWRGQAFYFSFILIWFYIVMIGLPASGVRAAIMGSIFLISQKLGRQNTSSRTIVLAGTLMLFQNPLLLFYDIGFQLSFLASMGIIHVKPLISGFINFKVETPKESKIKQNIKKSSNYLFDIVSVTLSAQIFTLPIMIYNFGNVSLIAPITNLLILPVVPFIMQFGFLAAILGIFSHFLGWVFYLPSWILLTYFLGIVDIFNQPWATLLFEGVSWVWILVYYIILGFLIRYINEFRKPRFLGY